MSIYFQELSNADFTGNKLSASLEKIETNKSTENTVQNKKLSTSIETQNDEDEALANVLSL